RSLAWVLAGGIAALAISQGIGRFAYTPLLPYMQQALRFGPDVAGYLAAANYAGYLIGALAAALVPPRAPRAAILRANLVVCIVAVAAMGLTTSLLMWAALRALAGITSAFVLVLGSDFVFLKLARIGRTSLKAVLFGGVGAGIAIAGLVVTLAVKPWGWDGTWLAVGAAAAVLAPLCWIGLQPPSGAAADPHAAPHAPHGSSSGFPVSLLLAAYFCEGLGYIVTGTFLVAIVASMPDLAAYAPQTWIVAGLAGVLAAPLWSLVAARIGLAGTLITAHLVQAAGIVLPVLSHSLAAVLLSALAFGGTFTSISGLSLAFGGQLMPQRSARLIGVLTAAFGIGQVLGPIVAGELEARHGDFDTTLVLAAGAVAFGAVLLVIGLIYGARRRHPAWGTS
ncbi:MAG: YbfB/YjiJ family MFS transporter, partial [Alphaproteobacteria bacterium]|nr:YbfB/YjiJ family MFS transporter [Alphaproteobacteria bacterium]